MIEVTDAAIQAVAAYFKDMDVKPIRIFLTHGCGGRQLAMALDDVQTTDAVCEAGGFRFIMAKTLLEQSLPVLIDYAQAGFRISSSLDLGKGCQSCGTAGSCCGS